MKPIMRYSLETKPNNKYVMDLQDKLGFWATLIIFLVLLLSPFFFWGRWVFRAYKKKDWWAFGISGISLLLFILCILWPELFFEPYKDIPIRRRQIVDNLWHMLCLFILMLVPPSYFLAKWIINSFKHGKRFLKIIGISFIALVVGGTIYALVHFRIQNRVWMGENLGINIPFSGSTIDYIVYPNLLDYPDGNVRATVQFDVQTAADLERQIKSIRYFGPERLALFGNNMLSWNKSYQLKCKEVKDYLYAKGVTGLWYFDKKEQVYRFYEPRIGRCDELRCEANAQLLFNRSYRIVASFNPKTRTLYYQFSSYR
jgi:hypothetical protein